MPNPPLIDRCRRRSLGLGPSLALALSVLAPPAAGLEIIGLTEIVTNSVTGDTPGLKRSLKVDDDVYLDEMIRTGTASAAHIRFADRSDLRLGPSAQIRLNAFVFSGRRNSALQLTRGALRFISGDGPGGSYQIRTPVATIGLRGTGVGLVLRGGRAYVTLLSGAARVCPSGGGACQDLVSRCHYVAVDRRAALPERPLEAGIPSFASVCAGPACGDDLCPVSASTRGGGNPPPGGRGQGSPARGDIPGYDPAGGGSVGGGGNAGGGGGGQGGRQ